MLNIKCFFFNPLQTRCIVIWREGGTGCLIADPSACDGHEQGELFAFLDGKGLTPERILLTHGHFDHVFGVGALRQRYGCPVLMHPADTVALRQSAAWAGTVTRQQFDSSFPTVPVAEGDEVCLGGQAVFRVIETPGHTPGGVCYYNEEEPLLLSGDTLFSGTIGRTDLPGGDYDALIRSVMDRLMGLPGETTVLPGHGSPTTIGREAGANPFLVPFNEPGDDAGLEGLFLDNEL